MEGAFDPAVSTFQLAMKYLAPVEGGWTVDTGGPTYRGVTQTEYNRFARENKMPLATGSLQNIKAVMTKNITKDVAAALYHKYFYRGLYKYEKDYPKTTVALFDAAVNGGNGRSAQFERQVVAPMIGAGASDHEIAIAVATAMRDFRRKLAKSPKYSKYLRGWENRYRSLVQFLGGPSSDIGNDAYGFNAADLMESTANFG